MRLEELAILYARDIVDNQPGGLNAGVGDLELRDPQTFQGNYILADYGTPDSEDVLALLLSSNGAMYKGKPITSILIPDTPQGSFYVSGNSIGTNFFYCYEDGEIRPIKLTSPLAIDGLNFNFYSDRNLYKGPMEALLQGSAVQELCNSKIDQRRFFKDRFVKVPDWYQANFATHPLDPLKDFIRKRNLVSFVVKGSEGSGGNEVQLFLYNQKEEALKYMAELYLKNQTILVEQRIWPIPFRYRNFTQKIVYNDWNIRSFVTLEKEPQWIDGLVRYSDVMEQKPVNICQGAGVMELETFLNALSYPVERIKKYSRGVARWVYDCFANNFYSGNCHGYLGLDLIANRKGVYLIEINGSSAGGFAELMDMRKKPLDSVKIYLESTGPLLERNAHERKLGDSWKHVNGMGRLDLNNEYELTEEQIIPFFNLGFTRLSYDGMMLLKKYFIEHPEIDLPGMTAVVRFPEELPEKMTEGEGI